LIIQEDHPMIVLAEIGDKVPSVLSTLVASVIITAVVLGLARLKWWLALLALPIFGFWNWICYIELQEPGFGNQIWNEMGAKYVVGRFASINIPIAIGVAAVAYFRRVQIRHHRRSNHLCPDCGYPLGRNPCSECGASVGHPRAD
jgi:hypothetical protein